MAGDRQGPLARYLTILEMVAASHRGLTLTDIAVLTGLPKPTVHRLVGVLLDTGALRPDEEGRKTFRIGARLWTILHLAQDERIVANYAQLVCNELAAKLGETCYLVRLGWENIRSIARAVPDQGHGLHVLPGDVLPPHAAASARAILAFQSDAVTARILREPLPQLTQRTCTDLAGVRASLAEVRARGYAVCDREIDDNVMAYGYPVHLPGSGVLYSIGVTGPCSRLRAQPEEAWIAELRAAAKRFAEMLTTVET